MSTLPVMHQNSVLRNHMLCNNMLRNVGDDVAQHDVAQHHIARDVSSHRMCRIGVSAMMGSG